MGPLERNGVGHGMSRHWMRTLRGFAGLCGFLPLEQGLIAESIATSQAEYLSTAYTAALVGFDTAEKATEHHVDATAIAVAFRLAGPRLDAALHTTSASPPASATLLTAMLDESSENER